MGYDIVMTEEELNGPERFAADNVLTEEQCHRLMRLANVSYTAAAAAAAAARPSFWAHSMGP